MDVEKKMFQYVQKTVLVVRYSMTAGLKSSMTTRLKRGLVVVHAIHLTFFHEFFCATSAIGSLRHTCQVFPMTLSHLGSIRAPEFLL